MKKILKSKFIFGSIFVLFACMLEMISYTFMFHTPFADYFYLDMILFIFLTFPIFFFKSNRFSRVYLSIVLFLIAALCTLNTNFYLVFGDVFSLQYFQIAKEGLSVISFSYIDFLHLGIVILLYILFVVFMYLLKDKLITEKKVHHFYAKGALSSVILLVISLGGYLLTLQHAINYEKNVKDNPTIDLVTLAKSANFQKLGMLSYYNKEIDYLYLNSTSTSKEIIELQNYFLSAKDTRNDFTGILENYNVMTIMIETGAQHMVNETLTPNLYSLMKESVNCVNNYSKNKTNISEYLGIVGNYPTTGLDLSKSDYELPFSVPNLLASKNYTSMFFHDVGGSRDIYKRKNVMPQLGFDKSYFHDDLLPGQDIWNWGGNYELDSVTAKSVIDFIPFESEKPFYTFWTTLSMHGPYYKAANQNKLRTLYYEQLYQAILSGKWVNPLKDDPNGNEICMENYMMEVMDFDKALGEIIQAFKDNNAYDNTLFVLYGDHEVYYNGADGKPLNLVLAKKTDLFNYDIFQTVLTFSNPTLNNLYFTKKAKHTMDEFTSPLVIVPTVLDLLGIDYNENYYLGNSIFSPQFDDEQVFYSHELSNFFNDHYYSKDGLNIFRTFNDGNESTFLSSVSNLVKRQIHIDKIYNENIFSKYDYTAFK